MTLHSIGMHLRFTSYKQASRSNYFNRCILVAVILFLHTNVVVSQSLPPEGVIFDDFDYTSNAWNYELDGWDPDANTGSVFGTNLWDTPTGPQNRRAWYVYHWQEDGNFPTGTSIAPTTIGPVSFLNISAQSGHYAGHINDGSKAPTIASGFTARRGTWAARVNFGDVEPAALADLIEGFWTQSIANGYVNGSNRWNEIDFEWNNRFRDWVYPYEQTNPYLATGYTYGSSMGQHRPLFAPAWPNGIGGNPTTYYWNCKYVWGAQAVVQLLNDAECSQVLNQTYIDPQGNTPWSDPGIVLFIQVRDSDVFFGIQSDGWGGVIAAHTVREGPPTNLPMVTLFSLYIHEVADLNQNENFLVDWVYYSPSTSIDINNVNQHVVYLQNILNTPRYNSTGLNLERPFAHLDGTTQRTGRTTPLSLDFSLNPSYMLAGESKTLLALPPLRHGLFRYSWQYRINYNNGTSSPWTPLPASAGGWEASFTFPSGPNITNVIISVTLEELNPTTLTVINAGIAIPITRTFAIYRGYAGKAGEVEIPSEFILEPNYPNPFNPQTGFRFGLPEASYVLITITDALGREVARLVDGFTDAGYHSLTWDASSLPSGVYLYRMESGHFVQTRKMTLVK